MRGIFDTDPQAQAADKAVMGLRAAFLTGAAKIGISTGGFWSWVFGVTNEQDQIVHSYQALGKQIERWATTLKGWAVKGQRDDGTAYSWQNWTELGAVYRDAIKAQTGYAWDTTPLVLVANTAKGSAGTVANAFDKLKDLDPTKPLDWPWWLQLGAGAVVLVGGAYVVNAALDLKATFTPRRRALSGHNRRRR
jgi:hypothetical protein